MIAMLGQHSGTVAWSVALHVAIFAALTLTFRWPISTHLTAVPAPIQGIIVDQSVLRQEQQRRDQEAQRKQRDERQKREAAEQQQREKEASDKRERDRVADQQRQKEQADREKAEAVKVAQEKAAKEKAAQEKAAQEKAAQETRDKQAREDAARKQKEALAAKQKAQAESDLQKELAAEAARQEAERSGVLDEYIRLIQDKIERNWSPPLSAKAGLECIINVVQLPTGDVYDAKVDASRCNGDEAVRLSIEKAVRDASPLPKPPSQAVFERNLIVTFKPNL